MWLIEYVSQVSALMVISPAVITFVRMNTFQAVTLFVSLYIVPNPANPSGTIITSPWVQPLAYV